MPATYAHYLFGEKVTERLTGDTANIIQNNKQLFYIGLHGPDLLFFFKPIKRNEISAQGHAMHDRPANQFFKRAGNMLELSQDKEAATAYLLGFVCHYALDHACHSYIEKKIQVSGLDHAEIENEFDRYLIIYNGKEVKHTDLCAHITSSKKNAEVIAPFFENLTVEQTEKAIKSMKFYNNFLIGNRAYKRLLFNVGLRVSGSYDKLKGAMMHKDPMPECEDSNKRLFDLFCGAVDEAVSLMNAYLEFLGGNAPLDARFDYNFVAVEGWQDIPI